MSKCDFYICELDPDSGDCDFCTDGRCDLDGDDCPEYEDPEWFPNRHEVNYDLLFTDKGDFL